VPRFLMGFDIGGGSGRCALVDVAGGPGLVAARPWSGTGSGGPGNEFDLERMFAALAEAAREVVGRAGPGCQVLGIAVAGMRFGSVVEASDGAPILATTNRDARAVGEAFGMAAEAGDDWQRRSGHWPAPILTSARLRWLRVNQPEQLRLAAHVLSPDAWLAGRLCGERALDRSQAGVTGLFDLAAESWSAEALAALELPAGILPPVVDAGTPLGKLDAAAAEALGLPAGTPVAVGGADTQCALLGMGALAVGSTGAVCGTTLPLQRVVSEARGDAAGALWLEPHVLPHHFVLESNAGPTGECLDWLGAALYPDAPNPALRLLAEASLAEPGAGGMLSTLGAQVMNARQLALPVGDLTLSHLLGSAAEARPRMARAVVEGLAFAVRANLEQLEAAAPASVGTPLRLGGGMSRSGTWTSLLAEALGEPVEVASFSESTVLGAALCAGVGAGVYGSLAEAAEAQVQVATVVPEPAAVERYAGIYPRWREIGALRQESQAAVQGHAIQALISGASGAGSAARAAARPRILVTADLDPQALEQLGEIGEVESASYREVGRLLTGPPLVEALQGFSVFVTEIDLVDSRSLLELPELQVVATCRGDAVNVDVAACTTLGVPVLHTPGRNADAVADLTLAFLLALARKLPEATAFLRDPQVEAGDMGSMGRAFGTLRGQELWRKTVGLVGLGAVGRQVAARLRPFGVRVLSFDPWIDAEAAALAGVELVELDPLLAASDFVSLHAAVTDASRGLMGASAFAAMKPGAFLVNTARAALVDEDALLAALEDGSLAGAALDVFNVEPPGADHPLLRSGRVIATPHVGGNTFEIGAHQGRIVSDDLARLFAGETPHHLLNREVLDAFDPSGAAPRPEPDAATRAELLEHPPPSVTDLQRDKKKPAASRPAEAAAPTARSAADEAARGRMRAILESFTTAFGQDPAVAARAAGGDVTLHFHVTDLDLEFFLQLREGAVAAGVGAPAQPAPVALKMRAQVLDGMLSGRINATQEAMNGGISFSGDAGKAMTLMQLQDDLQRLYVAASDRLGGPGELPAATD
jgi:autoinducer 2 (AI-2) kinase